MALVFLVGTATPPGRLHRAVLGAAERTGARGTRDIPQIVDLAHVPFSPADGRPPAAHGADLATAIDAVAGATALVIATPVYRASLTGILKNFLDHLPAEVLRDTPTGIVSMGASDHHYLGADRHLRDILAFFGAILAPTSVYLTPAGFDARGAPLPTTEEELDALVAATLALADRLQGEPTLGPTPLALRAR